MDPFDTAPAGDRATGERGAEGFGPLAIVLRVSKGPYGRGIGQDPFRIRTISSGHREKSKRAGRYYFHEIQTKNKGK